MVGCIRNGQKEEYRHQSDIRFIHLYIMSYSRFIQIYIMGQDIYLVDNYRYLGVNAVVMDLSAQTTCAVHPF